MRDLLSIEVPVTLNQALCERHHKCPTSEQLTRECTLADEIGAELTAAYVALEGTLPDPCIDLHEKCPQWAAKGECTSNPGYMLETCEKSCGGCQPRGKKEVQEKAPDVAHTEGVAVGGTEVSPTNGKAAGTSTEQQQGHAVGQKQAGTTKTAAEAAETQQARQEQQHAAKVVTEDPKGVDGADLPVDGQLDATATFEDRVEKLAAKCRLHPEWMDEQVERCLELAGQGMMYDPITRSGRGGDVKS